MGTRELRKNLRVILEAGQVVIVGNWHGVRAFVVPVEHYVYHSTPSKNQALKKAARAFSEALKREHDSD